GNVRQQREMTGSTEDGLGGQHRVLAGGVETVPAVRAEPYDRHVFRHDDRIYRHGDAVELAVVGVVTVRRRRYSTAWKHTEDGRRGSSSPGRRPARARPSWPRACAGRSRGAG